jgi:two-component system CheB/CheR fusion protein
MTQRFENLLKLEDTKHKIYSKIPPSVHPHAYSLQKGEASRTQPHPANKPPVNPLRRKRSVAQLRQELESARARLHSVIEQSEADTQELQTANEELQASNEELQSPNEELENTREQLEFANEALERSNQEALQLNDHLGNLLSSIQMPIIMVDHDLRIQRFTPAAKRLLNITDRDVGRPFTDLNLKVDLPCLPGLLREVMDTFRSIEEEVQDSEGRWYSLQVRPYKTLQNRIEGAVVTMVDIDQLKRDREKLRLLVELISEPIIVWDFHTGVVEWNRGCEQLYGFTRTEAVGAHHSRFAPDSKPRAAQRDRGATRCARRMER